MSCPCTDLHNPWWWMSIRGRVWPCECDRAVMTTSRHPCHECHAEPCRHVTGIQPSPAPAARHSSTPVLRWHQREWKWINQSSPSQCLEGLSELSKLCLYYIKSLLSFRTRPMPSERWHDPISSSWSQLRRGVWLQHSLSSHVLDTLAQRSLSRPPPGYLTTDLSSVAPSGQWLVITRITDQAGEWTGSRESSIRDIIYIEIFIIVKRLGLGLGTWDLGPGTWDLGPGTWDLGIEKRE